MTTLTLNVQSARNSAHLRTGYQVLATKPNNILNAQIQDASIILHTVACRTQSTDVGLNMQGTPTFCWLRVIQIYEDMDQPAALQVYQGIRGAACTAKVVDTIPGAHKQLPAHAPPHVAKSQYSGSHLTPLSLTAQQQGSLAAHNKPE